MGVDIQFLFDHQLSPAKLGQLPARLEAIGLPCQWLETPIGPPLPGDDLLSLEGNSPQPFWLYLYPRTAVLWLGTRLFFALRDASLFQEVLSLAHKVAAQLGSSRLLLLPDSGADSAVMGDYASEGLRLDDILTLAEQQGIRCWSEAQQMCRESGRAYEFSGYFQEEVTPIQAWLEGT